MVKRLFSRREDARSEELTDLRLAAERAQALVEESREVVVVLDEERRVVAASRRARESLDNIAEGAPFPEELLDSSGGEEPLEIGYEIDGRRELLLYFSGPGDLAAYQELRAGFTAAVSHELRTPLARLMVLLDSVSLPGSDPDELVQQARGEVLQIGELIDDVLFLSELESGRVVVSLGTTRALGVLERVIEELTARADTAGVTLVLDCPATVELPLRERMLEVIGTNLVENAIRYAGEGATFTLSVRRDDGELVVSGADSGAGVSEDDLPRLFERFYRADRARSSRGTGLGLAIVKHIVTAAGGTVDAHRAAVGGLEIRCSFPA